MTELLTAAQMRAIERAAIDSGDVTGLELMERAGRGVVEAIFEEWPELGPDVDGGAAPEPPGYLEKEEGGRRAVVVCGPGNNGGDGFVVARLLKGRGWEVEVFFYGDAGKLPPDARANYERWGEMGAVEILAFPKLLETDAEKLAERIYGISGTHILVDAMFGTGLTRPIDGLQGFLENNDLYATFPDLMPVRTVAVDIPSGICSDSGKVISILDQNGLPWAALQADLVVSFHRLKVGHFLNVGSVYSGSIRLKPIGLESMPLEGAVNLGEPAVQRLKKHTITHKYHHGHALILAGGPGKGGAARLAARGALRIGAGLVTVGCPPQALAENAARLDALMVRTIGGAEALAEVLTDARFNALCLGPGLGVDERGAGLVAAALASPSHPSPTGEGSREGAGGALPLSAPERGEGRGGPALVLDADALTILAGDAGLFAALHEDCVLTPHAGEFARLFPDIAEKLNAPATKGPAYSKVDATREAAARAGCVVLFKGPDTVIADAKGRCSINSAHYERSAPWLATAGSGDVLAGFITGLLARGFAPMQAAETGAWLHVECALKFGPGLIAEDLPEQLPAVFRDLGV